jgi:hypothetical protein
MAEKSYLFDPDFRLSMPRKPNAVRRRRITKMDCKSAGSISPRPPVCDAATSVLGLDAEGDRA